MHHPHRSGRLERLTVQRTNFVLSMSGPRRKRLCKKLHELL